MKPPQVEGVPAAEVEVNEQELIDSRPTQVEQGASGRPAMSGVGARFALGHHGGWLVSLWASSADGVAERLRDGRGALASAAPSDAHDSSAASAPQRLNPVPAPEETTFHSFRLATAPVVRPALAGRG